MPIHLHLTPGKKNLINFFLLNDEKGLACVASLATSWAWKYKLGVELESLVPYSIILLGQNNSGFGLWW